MTTPLDALEREWANTPFEDSYSRRAASMVARLLAEARRLEQERASILRGERALSDAYLRLRRLLAPFGSLETPPAPSGPQVWATTERALGKLLSALTAAQQERDASATLCRIYFDIAAAAIGEEEVRRLRDVQVLASSAPTESPA